MSRSSGAWRFHSFRAKHIGQTSGGACAEVEAGAAAAAGVGVVVNTVMMSVGHCVTTALEWLMVQVLLSEGGIGGFGCGL